MSGDSVMPSIAETKLRKLDDCLLKEDTKQAKLADVLVPSFAREIVKDLDLLRK